MTSNEQNQKTSYIKGPLIINASFLLANNIGTMGLGFLFWFLATRLISEADIGIASAIISLVSLLGLLSNLGLGLGVIRFLPKMGIKKSSSTINSCMILLAITSTITASISLILLKYLIPNLAYLVNDPQFIGLFILSTVIITLTGFLGNVFVSKRLSKLTLIKDSALFSVLKVVFLLFVSTAIGVFASWSIAMVIAFSLSVLFLLPRYVKGYKLKLKFKKKDVAPIFRFSVQNYFVNIMKISPQFLLPILVVNMLTFEMAAHFYIGWMFASILFAIPTAISTSLFTEGSYSDKNLKDMVKKSLQFTFLLLAPCIIAIYFWGDTILNIFGSGYVASSSEFLLIASASTIPMAFNFMYVSVMRVKKKIFEIGLMYLIILVITIILSTVFVPLCDLNGIGYAWLIAQLVALSYVLVNVTLSKK